MPYDVRPGGNRRLDHVLAEDYLSGLPDLSLAEVRQLRDDADQEEVDLSYLRRLLQGRLDILGAELQRREEGREGGLVESLATILAEHGTRGPAFGMGRHGTKEPSRAGESRRYVEGLVSDPGVSDVSAQSTEEITAAIELLRTEEHSVSGRRRQVQAVFDACSAEITRRYRTGEADPLALLQQPGAPTDEPTA
jgi:hypothetical protein